jgi:hypothetical protein
MTKYEVQDAARQTVSTHRTEAAAIKAARKIDDSRVMMRETSGTYKSTTCIHPEVGATYSN